MNNTRNSGFMAEEDLLYTILADLKRTSREYATGVTEAACPTVRQMFTDLTNSTLKMQGELFTLMEQNNMYSVASPALRQEVNKQLQQNQQTQMKTNQFVQQKLSGQQHNYNNNNYTQGNYQGSHSPNYM
ncbi:spore coat protein [Paenibacillus apiarius]|uniref:Spore coat protein n=1 Tax=Paenibacillus apiarius TaxID=46240 RepID=A0ABT4DVA7_9BACL|nr:spore coat protein [Paenibacillus apiarius]MBN3523070.1 spore coat protein [Paenibacillus apiarius]MCY9516686.1 spore coat protein [Paenibacillus apiarius]MCY9519916.1 spore coat protein [Paenibacillus apiarius]MCY9553846.1 spore coat protein [Paenibacillus apiarius]MCY9557546.1 spore coat protein [Paenibacillus apiarius]